MTHWLTISDVYLALNATGLLKHFECELRLSYKHLLKEYVYAPDLFFIWNKRAYLMEVQLKALSRKEWGEKWKRWNEYFNNGHHLQAPWQRFKQGGGLVPHMAALSKQDPEIVRSCFGVSGRDLLVHDNIQKLINARGD
ncbi:hypothetical protein ICC18_14145 [Paenibacillus sp. WST5]|uniref:Uncharacterized protein n=2 Tax=Paenibacillus sedimenti TaxID=2770274 RepID=A0A926KPT2_9BACL|nr:hypothetical protein [Paenibacillus sedimenti]